MFSEKNTLLADATTLMDLESLQRGLGREPTYGELVFLLEFGERMMTFGVSPDTIWLLGELMATDERMRDYDGNRRYAGFRRTIQEEAKRRVAFRMTETESVEKLRELYLTVHAPELPLGSGWNPMNGESGDVPY